MFEKQLASVAHWVGAPSRDQKVAGWSPGQTTCLGCGLHPWLGHVQETANRCFSPFPLLLSLK